MFQPFCKFIDVKHVWRKALSPHANRKLRVLLVEIKEYQAYAEQHAKGFKPALVLLCERSRHCYVRLRREQPVSDRLSKRDHRCLRINFDLRRHYFLWEFDQVAREGFVHANNIRRSPL